MRSSLERERPIDLRYDGEIAIWNATKRPPSQQVWMRADGALPDDPALHQVVVAYASDMTLLDTSLLPHGVAWADDAFQIASLDHAMWFHRRFRADEWLLYDLHSPNASGARGFTFGRIFTRDGELAVSVAQEGLMRRRTKR
jgi:acyl-CoA thioesterase-2